MSRPVAFAITALLLSTSAFAQDRNAEIEKMFSTMPSDVPGCTVAATQNGKLVINRAFGVADLERNVPITPASVFDAGSVVKQFIASSILLLVEDGKLSLSDDIHKYIPELPAYGHKVTVDNLLTHTSGIRDWTGLRPFSEGDPQVLDLIMRQKGLNFVPGDELGYSNSGYELLREIVARAGGMSYPEFMQKRIFTPLEMKSSAVFTDMGDVIRNRALPYAKDGDKWKQDMRIGNNRGSGGLMTTATDLLVFYDALMTGRLSKFVTQKIQEPAVLNNGRKLEYARGVQVDDYRGTKRVWHSGAAGGYSALLGGLPDQGIAVAVMCNADGGARGSFASRIFDMYLPATFPSDAQTHPALPTAPDPAAANVDVKDRAGLFFDESNGQALRLAVNNNTLAIPGVGPLRTMAGDRFRNTRTSLQFMSMGDYEVHFLSDDRFEMTTKEGGVTYYRRARQYTPTPADLKAVAGRYVSDELTAEMEIAAKAGGLALQFYRTPDKVVPLTPVERDTYMAGQMVLRFIRNNAGKVIGYDYSNPVVRNIRYTRAGG